jgi:HK97 family phage portal protein
MNIIEKLAYATGKAYVALQNGMGNLSHRARTGFIGAMAQAGRWQGGDYSRKGAQKRAMQNSWIYTAINLITNEFSAATLKVMDVSGADEPLKVGNHPLLRLLRRPNPFISRAYLWIYTLAWLLLDGNAYWFILCDEDGIPNEIWPLPSRDVEVFPGESADRFIDYYKYIVNGREYHLPFEYVVHFQFPNPFDIFRGLSPLIAAMLPVDADLAMAAWNGTFFGRDNVMPSGVINLKPPSNGTEAIDPADFEAFKADLTSEYSASRRKTLVTQGDAINAVILGWNAKDMDFISGRQFSKEEIYAIYGVPAGLLDKNATEANAQVADKVFKEKTIWPLMILLGETITAQLVIPFYGEGIEAQWEDIRPANRVMDMQEAAAARGVLTIDEIRRRYWQEKELPNKEGATLGAAPVAPAFGGIADPSGTMSPNPLAMTDSGAMNALRSWQSKSVRTFKQTGKAVTPFDTEKLLPEVKSLIAQKLSAAKTEDEIKAVFSDVIASRLLAKQSATQSEIASSLKNAPRNDINETTKAASHPIPFSPQNGMSTHKALFINGGVVTHSLHDDRVIDDPLGALKDNATKELETEIAQYFDELKQRVIENAN